MSDREVQLPDYEPNRAGGVGTRRFGLGSADRTGAVQTSTRPLPHVLLRRTAAAPGGDGPETQQVEPSCRAGHSAFIIVMLFVYLFIIIVILVIIIIITLIFACFILLKPS